jgi:4-hydroxybenzoate polyprenyltransferase
MIGGTLARTAGFGIRHGTRRWARTSAVGAARPGAPVAAPLVSFGFLRGYVVTMRPYLLFVSGITGLVGLALAPGMPTGGTLLLAAAFFLSYGFGQALTDCYQLDTDSLSAPYRPLVRGTIRRGHVLLVSFLGLAACGVIVTRYNDLNIPLAVLTVAGIATYTQFKRKWWAGPFYNSWIVAVLALIGYSAGLGAAGRGFVITPVLAMSLTAVFFGYANFVLTGYYKDISADRATGYHTLPVVFGLPLSNVVSNIFATLMLLSTGMAMSMTLAGAMPANNQIIAVAFFTGGAIATLIGQALLHTVDNERRAHVAIAPVVHAYILTLSAVAALQKPAWGPALLVFYVAFLVAMKVRPMREQI